MPARTALNMDVTFNGSLKIDNSAWQNNGLWTNYCPQNIIKASTLLGCSASIVGVGKRTTYEILSYSPVSVKIHVYYMYTVKAEVGLISQSRDLYSYCGWYLSDMLGGTIPAGAQVVASSFEVPFNFTINGIFAGAEIQDVEQPDRLVPLDYTDRNFVPAWYADAATSCVVTVNAPGGNLTATKTTGITVPTITDPLNIGSNFACRWELGLNYAPVIDVPLAAVSNPKFSVADINLSALPLHKAGSGEQPPDALTAGWYYDPPTSGAYWRILDDSGIALERCVAATTSAVNWAGATSMPYLTKLVFNDGAFSPELGTSIIYDCGAIEWVDGAYVPHYFTGAEEEWHEHHSDFDPPGWRRWGSEHEITASEKTLWRTDNGEDVGGAVATKNDARAGIKTFPITLSSWDVDTLISFIWQMLSVSLLDYIDLNDPVDAPARPSDWAAVSGCSVASDTWTVAIGATAPKVNRVLKTRYWLRLANLQGYSDDPELPRDFTWPRKMRPNLNATNGEDGAVIAAAVPWEDEYHLEQYAYAAVGITAPKAGTIKLEIKYSTVSVEDPCYSGVAFRAADWTYTREQHTATYFFDVELGANNILVDLCCPAEGAVPRLWHVDEYVWTLPNGSETIAEDWVLTSLQLVKDPTEGRHSILWRSVRSYKWAENYGFGWGAIVDGKPALRIGNAYGFSTHTHEDKLSYMQYMQHNPGVTEAKDPSYAKNLASMVSEMLWLRGWQVTYDIEDPCEFVEDEDGNVVTSQFYPWDILETYENSNVIKYGAPTVGTFKLLAGTPTTLHIEKYIQGKLEGIVKNADGSARQRSVANCVVITKNGVALETVSTNAQGWYRSQPVKEKDAVYSVNYGASQTVTNREYTTFETVYDVPLVICDPFLCKDITGSVFMVGVTATDGGDVKLYYVHPAALAYKYRSLVMAGDYTRPSITVMPDGRLVVAATNKETYNTDVYFSRDRGHTWEAADIPHIGTGIENGALMQNNGFVWLTGWADDEVILVCGDGQFFGRVALSKDGNTSAKVCDAVVSTGPVPRSSVIEMPDRRLLVAVEDGSGNTTLHFARDLRNAAGFEEVT